MSKYASILTTTLVIVESPAKCKKIEQYLGPGYKCIASYGHLRELNRLENIDIENDFSLTFTIIDNPLKKKQIELIKKEIKEASSVIIATDQDREGEGIGYSIIELFGLSLEKTKRITFNEITETAIQYAIQNPRQIDMNLVKAQQARQILDLLVGFKLSPLLWKFICQNKKNPLSAGRCQTSALRVIYDNEKEVNEVKERKIYNTMGCFTNTNIEFSLNKHFETEDETISFLQSSINFEHTYQCSAPVLVYYDAPLPLTTSRLQQKASNELHCSPKETMIICQTLYEAGLITYMRTDSTNYSKEFVDTVNDYIIKTYQDSNYIKDSVEKKSSIEKKDIKKEYKKRCQKKDQILMKKIEEAHESIRPTNILHSEISSKYNAKEQKMYKLIWETTLESCMSPSVFHSITATLTAPVEATYSHKSEQVKFPGWKIVSKKYLKDLTAQNPEFCYLQKIQQNDVIKYKHISSTVTITGTKQHYTEAKLVQLLEEKGIGRPSTFSSLVDKIQERKYVTKENIKGKEIICRNFELQDGICSESYVKREFGNEHNKLILQPLGKIVIEFLDKYFHDVLNYNYTFEMENALDKISKGEQDSLYICQTTNNQLETLIKQLNNEQKLQIKIDETHTYLIGQYGPVIKCTEEDECGNKKVTFKSVKKDIDIMKENLQQIKIEDLLENETDQAKEKESNERILGTQNEIPILLKKGRYGLYLSVDGKTKSLKELGNRPLENITLEELQQHVDSLLNNNNNNNNNNTNNTEHRFREITANLSVRKGPRGDYIFYKTPKMKTPKFFDISTFKKETNNDKNYYDCDISILKDWIKTKYKVY